MVPAAIKDWSAEERKLQSVYDDVESGRYKVALSQVDRHLKKQPKSQPALVIRAYTLHKLDHPVQTILKIWQSIEETGELSSRSLWWASVLLRDIRRYDILLKTYQDLWTSRPTTSSLGEVVYLTAVACWDLEMMCNSSRKMFNLMKNEIWARIAAWSEFIAKCQSHLLEEEDSYPTPNPTALRVSLSLLSTTRKQIQSSDILWLHAQIYLAAGMEDEALSIVSEHGMNGSIARNWYRIQTIKEVLRRRKERNDLEGVERVVEDVLPFQMSRLKDDEEMQRNYANYTFLNDLVIYAFTDTRYSAVSELYALLQQSIGNKERAPALAALDLLCKLKQLHTPSKDDISDNRYSDLIDGYWARWGSKGCVIEDLLSVCGGRKETLNGFLIQESDGPYSNIEGYMKVKHAKLLHYRICAESHVPTDLEFASLWSFYLSGRQFALNTPKTDVKPADEIGLAAGQTCILLWHSTKEDRYLFRAVLSLRQLIVDSPSNVYAKILLINVYRILGALNLTFELFQKLDLKEIQLDTLAYPLMDRCTTDIILGQGTAVFEKFKASAEYMYNKTATDMPEYMKQALENESYSKPPSMFRLAKTLSFSYAALNLATESSSISLLSSRDLKLSHELKEVLKDHEKVNDTYDWSMLPTLVGKKEMRMVLSAEGWDIDSKGLKESYEVLKAVRRFEVGVYETCKVDLDTIHSHEQRMLKAICFIVNQATSALTSAQPSDSATNGGVTMNVQNACSDFLSRITELPTLRWDVLHSGIVLVQFYKMLQIIFSRLSEVAKPKKGKKADSGIASIITEMKDVVNKAKEVMKTFSSSLIMLKKHSDELGPDGVEGSDDDFVNQVMRELNESRSLAVDHLIRMLETKA